MALVMGSPAQFSVGAGKFTPRLESMLASAMHSFSPEPHEFLLLVLGVVMLLSAWLPRVLVGRAVSFPIIYILAGALLFALPLGLMPSVDPLEHGELTERLAELAVIVSLMGAGLKIDRAFDWRRWAPTWRLLAITMPLTILGAAALGWWAVGLAPASALLLGAVLAPTDPVLASEVQVKPPGEGGEDPIRFTLTSEAGLNDGLAFPFIHMAIAMVVVGISPRDWWFEWLAFDVIYKIGVGCAGGLVVGWLLGRILFRPAPRGAQPIAKSTEGSLALAATLLAYGAVELLHGYGFIAVFVAASALRRRERQHAYHHELHHFIEGIERWLMAVLLVLLGGASIELLRELSWQGLVVAIMIVVLIRPASGVIALLGWREPWRERLAIGFFGIRGIGSLYYLAFALNEAEFEGVGQLWAIVVTTICISALLHGLSATRIMRQLDERRAPPEPNQLVE
jgi:sodium/hydrogen antiporter